MGTSHFSGPNSGARGRLPAAWRSASLRYGLAVAGVAVAWGLREAFTPVWGANAFPFTFFFAPVALAAWLGGFRPALVTIVCAALVAEWHFVEPLRSSQFALPNGLAVVSFVMVALLIATPIEAMHRANERTSESNEGIKNLLESVDQCFCALDLEGRFTYVNSLAEQHFGRSKESLLGQMAMEIFPQVRGTELERQLSKAMFERESVEFVILSPVSGRWLRVRGYPSGVGLAVFFQDITERKQSEQQLQASTEYLDLAQEAGGVGFFDYDFTRNHASWTHGLLKLYGTDFAEFDGHWEAWVKRLEPADIVAIRELLRRAIARRKEEVGCEFRIHVAGGAKRWLSARAKLSYDSSGKPVRLTGVNVDVTALKEADAKVRQLNSQLQERVQELDSLFEAAPVAIWVAHDLECEHVTANRYVNQFLRHAQEDLADSTARPACLFLRHGKALPWEEWPLCVTARTGQAVLDYEMEVVEPENKRMQLLCNAVPLFNATRQVRGAIAVGVDITEQKNLEAQLQRRVEELEVLIEKVPVGIGIALDPHCLEIRGNAEFARMLGTPREKNLSITAPEEARPSFQVLKDGRALPGDDLPMQRACREDREIGYEELEVHRTDGSIMYELGGAIPLHDDRGAVRGCVGAFLDITNRKRTEEQLRAARDQLARANENLERQVEERTARLRETVADLEQFSYSISHDLRAPLRAMHSFSSLLLEEHSARLNEEALDYLERIRAAAQRMDTLICDVLTYSRVAQVEITLAPIDLDRLVRDIVREYPNLHPDSVQIDLPARLAPVCGNTPLLTQCISNLLGNAVKFVSPGTKPHLRIWTETGDDRVRFSVRDNGIGISPDHLDRIWRMFEREQHQADYDGTGIGLSVVKRAVERMGGRVGVESEPGQGSTFWFELASAESAA